MRELGSLAVSLLVSLDFIPFIRAQKDFLLPASASDFGCGAGGFRLEPSALAEALPLAFSPPSGFWPSLRVQAGERPPEARAMRRVSSTTRPPFWNLAKLTEPDPPNGEAPPADAMYGAGAEAVL